MKDTNTALTKCFLAAFPELSEDQVPRASLDTVAGWDSVATAVLLSLVGEEFEIDIDFELVERLTSYGAIYDYLESIRRL